MQIETMNASTDVTTHDVIIITVTSRTRDDVDTALGYVYVLLTTLMSMLSIIGCVLLVMSDVLFRELRSPGRRLLTWLSVADCLTAVGNLLGVTW